MAPACQGRGNKMVINVSHAKRTPMILSAVARIAAGGQGDARFLASAERKRARFSLRHCAIHQFAASA
jgi:hypothetical protein